MLKSKFLKYTIVFLAVIIASFPFTIVSSAASSSIYSADSLDDFFIFEDGNSLDGQALLPSWRSDFSDSIPVPYAYYVGSVNSTVSGKHLYLNFSYVGSKSFSDDTNYLVTLPVKFLVVGGVGYYPSSSFSLELNFYDKVTLDEVYLDIAASDYHFTDSNRGHFSCVFRFVVPGYVLNNSFLWQFHGYRSVSRSTPIRMSLSDDFDVSIYNSDSEAADKVIENNNYNTDRIIQNQKQLQDEILNGWTGEGADDSSVKDSEALEDSLFDIQTEIIVGFDNDGNAITRKGSLSELQTIQSQSIFNSFKSYFNDAKALKGVTYFITRLMNVPGLDTIFIFSLALAVIPLVVGLGINAAKGHDKSEARQAASEANRRRHDEIMKSLNKKGD